MEFLKKHYEKVLLSLVLVGLTVAAAWLPIKVSSVRQALQDATSGYVNPKVKPLPALDMTTNEMALKRLVQPRKFALADPGHSVFNPIKWRKKPDGTPVPDLDTGLNALSVTNIAPLYLIVEYKGPRDAGDNLRYQFVVTRQAATNVAGQRPVQRTAALGAKNEVFILRDIKGPKEDPSELILELTEFKATVSVTKEQPVRYLAGYAADFYYEMEKRSFLKQRAGQKLNLAGSAYNIVAIQQGDVTLEDSKTKKRTTIRWNAAP